MPTLPYSFLPMILHTPWWVWIAFGVLLFRGIKALSTSTGPIKNIFIIPTIFLAVSMYNMLAYRHNGLVCFWWACAIGMGIFVGSFIFSRANVQVDKQKGLITVPGSPLLLIMLLIIFSVKYCFGYIAATNLEIAHALWFIAIKVGMSGIVSGIFIGRACSFLYKYIRK